MRPRWVTLTFAAILTVLVAASCAPAAPAPAPTKPAAVQPAAATATVPPPTVLAATPMPVPTRGTAFPAKGKAISLIVPWDAGGSSDVASRLMASALEKTLEVPVQVVNKAGASGQTGTTELAKAAPDGYTIADLNLPGTILTYINPERKASYARKDFALIANQSSSPHSVAVKADSKYKSLTELVDAARTSPEAIKVGTAGLMGDTHMALLKLQKEAKVDFSAVHFTGGAPAVAALLGGHIDAVLLGATNFTSQLKSGEVRLLGIMSEKESRFYPGVKTMAQQGYNTFSGSTVGYGAPAGTPKEVVEVLAQAMQRAMDSPEMKRKMDEMYYESLYMGPSEFASYWEKMESELRPLFEEAARK